ncbi:pyridoxamine 5'-phosphate oxidase family protein [Adlercreutzia sp. ZJ242]|uniref:pyridoxamine 5'-phosphate oxidase family protein n=1 Tax=Adlercreutzia sp. ZJ242 TaxID=2709409 RepID=UPI0013E9E197|nr:pyridoxamine 5'-phosphate oxidase family protein [Adlercreutzia sp. ZJ242]
MFREMRRKKQMLSHEECAAILARGTSGVLALAGDEGYPYTVPLSYVFDGESLYFHSALAGHKIDAIAHNDKASFCVIDQDDVVAKEYTTYFRSVIAFGRAHIIEDPVEKRHALDLLAARYTPDDEEGRQAEADKLFDRTCMIRLAIEHLSGKEAIELARARA